MPTLVGTDPYDAQTRADIERLKKSDTHRYQVRASQDAPRPAIEPKRDEDPTKRVRRSSARLRRFFR